MLSAEKMNILLIIEGEIATTQIIERILLGLASRQVYYKKTTLAHLNINDFKNDTIPLFIRCGDPSLEFWIKLLQQANHPYLYYIDDNFWKISGNSALARYYQNPEIRRSLEYAIRCSKYVLTNSEELASFLKRFNPAVENLPAFFDFSLIQNTIKESTKEIRIGFAGSLSRDVDLEIIRPAIQPILESHPNVIFEFAGAFPKSLTPNPRIRLFPSIPNYEVFIKFFIERNWSIGLAPLIDNEANRSKTNNKYREYGACGIPGIYSDIPPYKDCIKHELTGLLIDNSTDSWFNAIDELCKNENLRKSIASQAEADVRANYSIESVSHEWEKIIKKMYWTVQESEKKPLSEIAERLSLIKIRCILASIRMNIINAYQEGGIKLVIKASLRKIQKLLLKADSN